MSNPLKRHRTDYPGVVYRETSKGRVYYIFYRRSGETRQIEDKLVGPGWTAARASHERARRINGTASNSEKRAMKREALQVEANRPSITHIWELYIENKGGTLRGIVTDQNRFTLHIEPFFGDKVPSELAPLDIERLRRRLAKDHSNGTVRNVLELLRRIINFGVKMRICPPLGWTLTLPKVDPDSERIEVLSPEQFQRLNQVWESYPDQHIANLHKLIGWTGMRPSEPLRLRWEDVDFEYNQITKRHTKSGRTILLRMNDTVRGILLDQLDLLDQSPEPMRTSPYVFPSSSGGERRRESYARRFKEIQKLADLPQEYRPNYCLRDTIASMMLSSGASLDEVGYQLGHEPGSPMTRRYARFVPDAQRSIASKAESALADMLSQKKVAPETPKVRRGKSE